MKTSLCTLGIVTAVLLATLTGCKNDGPSSKIFVRNGDVRPLRIAVLPFESTGRQEDAGTVVTNTVVAYLLSTNMFDVVEPGVVDDAMANAEGGPFRTVIEAMKLKNLQTLQSTLNIDAVIVGTVEDYGDIRIGNDTYPSLSFSARLVDARNGSIIWMGSISKTGADKVTLFDIGRVSSMGKLVKGAVREMASSMLKSEHTITVALKPPDGELSPAEIEMQKQARAVEHGTTTPTSVVAKDGSTPEVTPAVADGKQPEVIKANQPPTEQPTAPVEATAGGKSTDETKTYGENELTALLGDVSGFTRGDVKYSKHYHDTVETRYTIGSGPNFIEVELVDYRKVDTSNKMVALYHKGETETKFRNRPAFVSTNEKFRYMYLDLAVGRFGLFVKGPEAKRADIEKLTDSLINLIQ